MTIDSAPDLSVAGFLRKIPDFGQNQLASVLASCLGPVRCRLSLRLTQAIFDKGEDRRSTFQPVVTSIQVQNMPVGNC
jgi:hypothetical protein